MTFCLPAVLVLITTSELISILTTTQYVHVQCERALHDQKDRVRRKVHVIDHGTEAFREGSSLNLN